MHGHNDTSDSDGEVVCVTPRGSKILTNNEVVNQDVSRALFQQYSESSESEDEGPVFEMTPPDSKAAPTGNSVSDKRQFTPTRPTAESDSDAESEVIAVTPRGSKVSFCERVDSVLIKRNLATGSTWSTQEDDSGSEYSEGSDWELKFVDLISKSDQKASMPKIDSTNKRSSQRADIAGSLCLALDPKDPAILVAKQAQSRPSTITLSVYKWNKDEWEDFTDSLTLNFREPAPGVPSVIIGSISDEAVEMVRVLHPGDGFVSINGTDIRSKSESEFEAIWRKALLHPEGTLKLCFSTTP